MAPWRAALYHRDVDRWRITQLGHAVMSAAVTFHEDSAAFLKEAA